jgi:phosphoglycolate phosphatase
MFDLDGTLIKTDPEICAAINDLCADLNLAPLSEQQVATFIGHGSTNTLLKALSFTAQHSEAQVLNWPNWADLKSQFKAYYLRRCGTSSQLYPGVVQTLTTLAQRGTRLAVVTNKESRYVNALLQFHAIQHFFDLVVCGDTLATQKPDPSCIHLCLKSLQVNSNQSLFIGDSWIDALTAKNAGIKVWLLDCGYNMGMPIEPHSADRVIQNIGQVLVNSD